MRNAYCVLRHSLGEKPTRLVRIGAIHVILLSRTFHALRLEGTLTKVRCSP